MLLLIDFLRSGIVGFVGFMMFALISLFTPELVVKSVSNEIEKVSKEKCPGFYELYLAGLIWWLSSPAGVIPHVSPGGFSFWFLNIYLNFLMLNKKKE